METVLQPFQDLKIRLEEITSATNNFDDENRIGVGGFGKVYKGEVTHCKGKSMTAIKRLDNRHGQGKPEFLKEIMMLDRYKHENLVSLLGFCNQGDEMILVYEYASRGSLDRHLNSPHLTWSQRLKICLDVAKGLTYLHDPRETRQRLIHCDMKSANILLDDHWNAKISDFGLSIIGSANDQHSLIVTLAAGTPGYCDPQYAMTHTLTKESDVYSFGVVLFEVLCGTLCCTYSKDRVPQVLVHTWIESYKQKKLQDIIFKSPTIQALDQSAFETISDIAYRCLMEAREDRPKMAVVVTELETAFKSQEFIESNPHFDYEEITKTAEPPLNYRSKVELKELLSKGVLLNGGKTWFSLNKKLEHCEMIAFAHCLDSVPREYESNPSYKSRFPVGTYHYKGENVRTRVKTQFLTPGITYIVSLVFKFRYPKQVRKRHCLISLKYKLQWEKKTSVSYFAVKGEDKWWMAELYQFTSDDKIVDLEILFEGFNGTYPLMEGEGIEFRPLENVLQVEHEEESPISDLDAKWEENLPTDYENILKRSKNSIQWTTKKEAYSIIRNGFLTNDGELWVSLDENGKKCHMLSARVACTRGSYEYQNWQSLPESRFGEAFHCDSWGIDIYSEIQSELLSSKTIYASYLVYKLPKDQSGFEAPVAVRLEECLDTPHTWYIYLVRPQTPVIRPKADENTHNPLSRLKLKGLPKQRKDGWMEVIIWHFQTHTTPEIILMPLLLTICDGKKFNDLIIQGVEFRPI